MVNPVLLSAPSLYHTAPCGCRFRNIGDTGIGHWEQCNIHRSSEDIIQTMVAAHAKLKEATKPGQVWDLKACRKALSIAESAEKMLAYVVEKYTIT